MDTYTLNKIAEAEALVAAKKQKKQDGVIPLAQIIPITEKGSFILGYHGAVVIKAILRVCGRVISVIRPDITNTRAIPGSSVPMIYLNFLGEGKNLHAGLGNYKIEVELHFESDTGFPSLVQGYGAEPTLTNGQYVEDVTVTNADGVTIDAQIVYLPNDVGLRKK